MAALSESVLRTPRSGIRKIMELAQTMDDAIHLEVGEPLFDTPKHIVDAGCQALQDGYTKYTPNAGMKELRQAIAETKSKQLGLQIPADRVIVGIGGVEVINNAFRAICEPGDEILIPDPSWPNYLMMATIANASVVPYHLLVENNFCPDMDELEKLVTSRTKMIVVNSPSNPLGVIFPKETMQALVAFANRHDIYLLSDEAYEQIIYDGEMVSPLTMDTEQRVIAAHTLSKTYAMTGWRIGYVIAAPAIIQAMTKLQEAYVSSVPAANQLAAVAALNGPQDCVKEMCLEYKAHRDLVASILKKNGISFFTPSGAFYLWIRIGARNSVQFAEDFLRNEHVAVAPGGTFGESGEGWIRISLASSAQDLSVGVTRLAQYLQTEAPHET